MNKVKKNQIVIYSIVLMLVVAGYLNYIENDKVLEISAQTQNTTNIGDATLVSNNEIKEELSQNEIEKQEKVQLEINKNQTKEDNNEEKGE